MLQTEARSQGNSNLETVCVALNPKMYPHTKFGIPRRFAPDKIILVLELRPEVKVTVTQKWYAILQDSYIITLDNVNALVVATTSWWLHFAAQVVA